MVCSLVVGVFSLWFARWLLEEPVYPCGHFGVFDVDREDCCCCLNADCMGNVVGDVSV